MSEIQPTRQIMKVLWMKFSLYPLETGKTLEMQRLRKESYEQRKDLSS